MGKGNPEILVYRRTHKGDPGDEGIFGIHDCMGSIRNWQFEAVIGIGGCGSEPMADGIAMKITWVGIGPKKEEVTGAMRRHMKRIDPKLFVDFRGRLLTFDRFVKFDEDGPLLENLAPQLHTYMFREDKVRRAGKAFPPEIYRELEGILKLAANGMESRARNGMGHNCRHSTGERSTCSPPVNSCVRANGS